jgi:hypothetical protein
MLADIDFRSNGINNILKIKVKIHIAQQRSNISLGKFCEHEVRPRVHYIYPNLIITYSIIEDPAEN